MMWILPLALIALLTAAPAASAQWTAPAAISGAQDAFPALAFARDSGLTAFGGSGAYVVGTRGVLGVPTFSDGRTGAPSGIFEGNLRDLAGYGRDRAIILGGTFQRLPISYVAFGRTDATARSAKRLGPGYSYPGAVSANSRGDAAAITGACPRRRVSCGPPVPTLFVRRPGRSFGRAIRLAARGPSYSLAVAVNERGDALAVYDRPLRGKSGTRGVYARVRSSSGRLGREQRLGTAVSIPKLSVAFGSGRRAIVGWLGQRVNEGHAGTPADVWVAYARPGRAFGAPQRIERIDVTGTGRYVSQAGVRVGLAGSRPIVSWTGYENGRFVVRGSAVAGGEVRLPAQVLSDPLADTVLGDMAVEPGGAAVTTMIEGIRGADPTDFKKIALYASVLAAGGAFGPRETVRATGGYLEAVDVEISPRDARAVAVWRDLDAGAVGISSRSPLRQ